MAKRFLHIGFSWGKSPKSATMGQYIEGSEDWIKYGGNCWIVYTEFDASIWANHLTPHLSSDDYLIIYEIADIDDHLRTNGWMPKWVWEWTSKTRY